MANHSALENSDNTATRPEAALTAGLSTTAPDLQVGRPPRIETPMPAEFGTPKILGLYEDNPVGPVVPYGEHDGPQLGGHNSGTSPNIDIGD